MSIRTVSVGENEEKKINWQKNSELLTATFLDWQKKPKYHPPLLGFPFW